MWLMGLSLILSLNVSGQNIYAIGLDGGESFVVNDGDNKLDLTTAYTFEAWICVAAYVSGNYECIMDRRTVFSFYLVPDDNNNYAVTFAARNGSGDIVASIDCDGVGSTSANMIFDTWYHVAATYDGTTAKLYINGTMCDSDTDTDWPLTASTNALNIGGRFWDSYERQMSNAQIDEIRVSNVARDISTMQTSSHWEEYTSDANTVLLMHLNNQADPPNYISGTGLNGAIVDDNITSIDYTAAKLGSPYYLLRPKYQSQATGNWSTLGTWKVENGADTYVNATIIPNEFTENIVIKSGHTVTTADNVTIATYGKLEISGNLSVTGTLTNNAGNAGLVLKSTATEQGSLLNSTANVDATVERQITGYAGDHGWHLLSSPVNNMAIAGSDFVPAINTDDLFSWDEDAGAAGMWINYRIDGGGFAFSNFTNGQGYLCAYDVDGTKEFQGKLNVANVSSPANMTNTNGGWQLVGNPFSCAIDWGAGTWTKTGIGVNAKVWAEEAGNYQTKTIIPSTQGFFVEITNATNQLTIPSDARIHDEQNWYKNAGDSENTLILKLSGGDNSFYDITQVIMSENATMEFDAEFDGHKLFGAASAPQLYTLSASNEFLTDNNIPNSQNEILIPMNFRVATQGEYNINVELNSIESENNIYLEDLATGVLTNLTTTNSYTFAASEQDNANRFMLHLNSTTAIDDLVNNKVNIFANKYSIYLNASESINGEIMVFDMGGRLILSEQIKNTNMYRISAETLNGVYLVRLIEAGNIYTQKVIIQ